MIFSGKYEVTEKVGQGGMGIVYRVRHLDLDTDLALKILPRDLSQDAELVERFRREARMMARLNHRNIVRVFDFVRDGDNYYLIMEFLQGKNLHQILHARGGADRLLLPEVLRIGAQIAEALAYAHEQTPAVVHRDIKPSNIIIEDKTARAVVTDFGIAKLMDQAQSDLTRSGLFVGTPKYCAPEQLRHDDDLDARVDIYSLGMVMYEIYSGRQFFAGLKDHEVIGRVLYEKNENAVALPEAPPEFVAVVERAINRDRAARYQTAAEMAADLQACLRQLEGSGVRGEVPPADETSAGDMGAIEAQIRALESKRVQRLIRQAQGACRKAREGAERAGAAAQAATEFGLAREREGEAEAQLERGEQESAASLFNVAATGFENAAAVARERRHEHGVEEARATMQAQASEAAAIDAAALVGEQWERAQALAAEAEAIAARREHEAASAKFRAAAASFTEARAAAERIHDLRAVEAELSSVASARASAEEAAAGELAGDAFAAAVRDQDRLTRAVAAGELTEARALLPQVCRAFERAAAAAIAARGRRATMAARERMAAAGDAARAAGAADLAAEELAAAAALAASGTRAEGAADWEAAQRLYAETAERYERLRELALARREEQRAQRELADARTATDAARGAAEQAGAAQAAATVFGRAVEHAARASAAAEAGDLARAATDYRLATDEYTQSVQVAERRARRLAVEAALADVTAARAAAVTAGAQEGPIFTAAEQAEAEAQHALAGDDFATSTAAAERALAGYRRAGDEAERAHRVRETEEALVRVATARTQALEAGADGAAPDVYGAAERLRSEAVDRQQHDDWQEALARATAAEEQYAASITRTVEIFRNEALAAKAAAEKAGASREVIAEAKRAEKEGRERLANGAAVAAARAFRDAAERYGAAGTEQRSRAETARREALGARQDAERAEAAHLASAVFADAVERFAAADEAFRGEQFGTAARGFAESARVFTAASAAAETTRRREAATGARAEAAEARARAERAGAGELPDDALVVAGRAFADAERAFVSDDFALAERGFREGSAAFAALEREAQRARAEREAHAAADRAQGLRATRGASARGLRARWRMHRIESALDDGRSALAAGEFARATTAFARASELLESLPVPLLSPTIAPTPVPQVAARRPGAEVVEGATVTAGESPRTVVMSDATVAFSPTEDASGAATILGDAGGAATVMGGLGDAATVMGGAEGAATVMGDAGAAATVVGPAAAKTPRARAASDAAAARTEVPLVTPVRVPSRLPWLATAAGIVIAIGAVFAWSVGRPPATDTTPRTVATAGSASGEKLPSGQGVAAPAAIAREQAVERARVDTGREQAEEVVPPAARGDDRIAAVEKPAALPTVVPAPPPQPPRIQRVEPAEATVRLQQGASGSFRIELADAAGASYRWTVGGRTLNDADGPVATIPVEDEPRQVVVVARTEGGEVTHRWELASIPRATPVAPVGPPVIAESVPDGSFELDVGSRRRLGVTVANASGDQLSYAWSVDGKRVGRDAASFEFVPADSDEGEVHRVKVQVTNGARKTAATEWAVTVPAAPVRIVRKSPGDDVTAPIGDQKELTVEARTGARTGTPLSYRWSVDGRTLGDTTGPRLAYRVDRPRADVQVVVEAPGRQAAIGRWSIRGTSAPTPKLDTRAGAQRELEQWIESYRQAYQAKNVDQLIALGVVSADQRSKMIQVLDDLEGLEVRIAARKIDPVSDDTATITLTRVDSFLIGRSRTEKEIPIKKTLRKRNGAWVAE